MVSIQIILYEKKNILEKEIILNDFVSFIKTVLKFVFSKKATNFDEIFTVDLTLTTYCQIDGEDFFNFVAFLENINFTEKRK